MRALELGTPGELRAELNSFVLAGKKIATTGLLAEYASETEGLEYPGERLALLDNDGQAIATVEITGVEVKPFSEVTWEHAAAEGEGDASLEEWRTGHRQFWSRTGTPVEDDTPLVCLTFRLTASP
ncbi:ASCH domain-containing protein [Streptomyces sp. NPDC057486]|uniref:ASCH domain-containing protein n=1 Tax=Streptomyces sp. NPDC057486 TaxID=3346145 RepID=UPI00369A4350